MQTDNQLGFIFKNLGAAQLPYCFITEANDYLKNNSKTDICAFFLYNALSCLNANFAKYNFSEIELFYGDLIATCWETCKYLVDIKTPKRKFYYITDLDWIRQNKDLEKAKAIMEDKNIVKFCRSKDYWQFLSKNYVSNSLLDIVIPNFEISKILAITNTGDNK